MKGDAKILCVSQYRILKIGLICIKYNELNYKFGSYDLEKPKSSHYGFKS